MALTDEKILEEYSQVLAEMAGHTDPILEKVEEYVRTFQMPDIQWKRQELRAEGGGLVGFIAGKHLEFMSFRHARMQDYYIHLTCQDFGDGMIVAWFLTCEPGFMKRQFAKFLSKQATEGALTSPHALSAALSIPNRLQLKGFATAVHSSVTQALKDVVEGAGKDPTVIKETYTSKGFLEAW